ncbi:MAG: histone deacetylase [Desulfobacterales bacterium]|nr:MAG: histone deacetylase [Desulfobacterales bacterium]
MIKRENIKQAIEAIAQRNPEIGYSLDEMLGTGAIGVPSSPAQTSKDPTLYFLFQGEQVPIRKYQYFNEGTVPLEQRLLIKYGELAQKQKIAAQGGPVDYRQAARKIRAAGLLLMVTHEIDYAMARVQSTWTRASEGAGSSRVQTALLSWLEKIKGPDPTLKIPPPDLHEGSAPAPRFQGVVDYVTPAEFQPFPFSMETLLQVAALNLEFFHVRFVLNCLVQGAANRLFACLVEGQIQGLIFLNLKTQFLSKGLEIKYLATVGGQAQDPAGPTPKKVKGVGTFLVAGTWLLWKTRLPDVKEISLDAEIGANRFYRSIGFHPRRLCEFVLKNPRGFLLRAIWIMAGNCRDVPPGLRAALEGLIIAQFKILRQKAHRPEDRAYRKWIVAFLKFGLQSETHPEFVRSILQNLFRYQKAIPEFSALIEVAAESDLMPTEPERTVAVQPVQVIRSAEFARHLEQVFHLENAKRLHAMHSVLQHPSLASKWSEAAPRLATPEELAWVHTPEYIERIAQTAGQTLTALDLDTQTTAKSYEVARLAVGSVFSLLDKLWDGEAQRGFACIRPPGHHAEPDKAMGFCLFNNTALGACYLRHRHGAARVMIVDIDAHHGNGIQAAFYDSAQVLYVSLHRFPGYPGTGNFGEVGRGDGEGFTVNVPLTNGHGDQDFAEIIQLLVRPLARQYQPAALLVACGFDLYLHDRLGGMRVTPEGYALITALLVEIAEQSCDGRIAFIMEGGYSIKGIQECGLRVMQELCRLPTLNRNAIDRIKALRAPRLAALKKAITIHRKYWDTLH